MALTKVDDALKMICQIVQSNPIEMIDLMDANQYVLAEDIKALLTQPPFDASAMDGYAVMTQNLDASNNRFEIIGESAAGHGFDGQLSHGQTVRIFTGAPLPKGADAVIAQEDVTRDTDNSILIEKPIVKNNHIRFAGNDFQKNQIIAQKNTKLTPSLLSLMAASGHAKLPVYKKPVIGLLATGDELVPAGSSPKPNQIISSNNYGIGALITMHGGQVVDLGIVGDNQHAIQDKLEAIIAQPLDLLITSGGVSVGDYDLVQKSLSDMGFERHLWKLAMRPGKPLMFGHLPRPDLPPLPILGLPGNPVSALVTAHIFLPPIMAQLQPHNYQAPIVKARLQKPLPANGNRRHYMRGLLTYENGCYQVEKLDNQDSAALVPFSRANCLIIHDIDALALDAGTFVDVFAPPQGL